MSNQRCLCTVCYNDQDDDDCDCDDDIDCVQDKSDEASGGDEFMDIFAQKDWLWSSKIIEVWDFKYRSMISTIQRSTAWVVIALVEISATNLFEMII